MCHAHTARNLFMNSKIDYGFIIYLICKQKFNKTKPIKIFKTLFLLSELDKFELESSKLPYLQVSIRVPKYESVAIWDIKFKWL